MTMDKVFRDSTDKDVAATYIYGKSSDMFAYADSNCTVKINTAKMRELFTKGAIIIIDGAFYKPVSYNVKSNIGYLTYVKSCVKSDSKNDTKAESTIDLATLSAVAD